MGASSEKIAIFQLGMVRHATNFINPDFKAIKYFKKLLSSMEQIVLTLGFI